MSRRARVVTAAILAPAAVWAAMLTAPPADAAPIGSCSTTRGTIIAVDFGHWSGPIVRGCGVQAGGQPDSSPYALLADGGFTTAGTQHDGPAYVCRIGSGAFHGGTQYPTPSEDHCVVTPPATAYWSFWLAGPGATSWTYATMSQPLPSGGVAYWEFGAGQTPSSSLIDQLRAHNTTAAGTGSGPAVAPPAATAAGTTPAATPTTPSPARTSARASTAAPGTATTSAAATTIETPTDPPPTGGQRSADASRVVAAVAPHPHGSGSALPLVITAAIVAALGLAGGFSLLRRRRREDGGGAS